MEDKQSWTIPTQDQVDAVDLTPEKQLKLQQDLWIDYCAIGGIITESGFEYVSKGGADVPEIMRRMSVTEFSQKVGVPRSTLYDWSKRIPNFGDRVRARRDELWPVARETAIFNRMYTIAMGSKDMRAAVQAGDILLQHFSKIKRATQHIETKVQLNSWGALMESKRKAVEAEVIDATIDANPN